MLQKRKCFCGKDSRENDKLYLCDECAKKYDLHKFWIKNQFQLGNWHRVNEFYNSENVRKLYIKDESMPKDHDWTAMDLFLTAYATEYDHGNMYHARTATVFQIIKEIEDKLM